MSSIVTLTMNPAVDMNTTVDNVVAERKLRCERPRYEPGGGGLNVSRAIHRLGSESCAVYCSGGSFGTLLSDLLESENISTRPIEVEAQTRINVSVYEETSEQQFRLTMPGPELKESEWQRVLDTIEQISPKPAYIVASGSLPPGVPDDFYARIARAAKKIGAKTILDSSKTSLRKALEEGVYLVKPNFRELRQIARRELEGDSEEEEFAKELVSEGRSEVVVVSLGAGGALFVSKDNCEKLQAPTVTIRSKVGAGDSMVAGIVTGLAQDKPLHEAVQFGMACGGAAVMTPGTELCRKEDAERLYACMRS